MRAAMVVLCGVLVLAGCSDDGAADERAGHEASGAARAVPHAEAAAGAEEAGVHENEKGQQGEDEHAGESGASDRIRLDAEQQTSLELEIASVEGGSARQWIQAPATAQFDPDSQQFVGPRVEARVAEVLVDLGDRVEAGTPLALLDSVALGRAGRR
ncbi:MAG: biotin/lipoyl-binding protein [Gammaproteobacteria bacterium]|nr:biotin/lipoyl-binding protein [Gammaproteobacteria bacterium]